MSAVQDSPPPVQTLKKPTIVYLLIIGASKLIGSLFATVQMVYFASDVTPDPLRLVLIWTVFQISVLLFEVPTGVVADVYSRRLSVILGFLVMGVGSLIVGGFANYFWVLLGMVVLGVADSFLSGALDAWLADEIGPDRVGAVYLRGSQIAQIAILAGIPIGTALGTITLNLPIILSGALYLLLGLALIGIMPEEGFQPIPAEARESWRTLFQTFRDGVQLVRGRSVLITILVISAVAGISTTGFEGLWTAHMLERIAFPAIGNLEPVVWFGVINATVSILSLLGMEFFRRRVDVSSQTAIVRMLTITSGITAFCMTVFGVIGNFWLAAGVYSLSYALRIASSPISTAWINQNVDSKVRATVLSMDNQVNYLGRMTGGPIVGAIGSAFSLPVALITTGLARIPITVLYARVLVKGEER
jgi:DHA3 family tetracycline resistance protein-like MFS transporter